MDPFFLEKNLYMVYNDHTVYIHYIPYTKL